MSCFSHALASVHCCLVVTCWERADLFALVGDVYCIFVTYQCGILCQMWYLIVLFPDRCRLSYFNDVHQISVLVVSLFDLFCTLFYSYTSELSAIFSNKQRVNNYSLLARLYVTFYAIYLSYLCTYNLKILKHWNKH